jgi:hypothetical protein
VKSHGMAHSRELRELVVSDKGLELGNVMTGNRLAGSEVEVNNTVWVNSRTKCPASASS